MHDPRLSALFERYRSHSDLSALAKLFDEISPEMMRVARHVAGRGVDPEDVVQSTFLASIERADAFDSERPIVPWLMGILINQARLMNRRRATRHEEAAADDIVSDAYEPDDAEAAEVRSAVARALADLPPTYREVLVAHLAEGKPPHEIARELGRPQGTVRAQLHRGLRIVRRSLPTGFALGVAAMLDRSALAQVRVEVLAAGARAKSLPDSAIPAAASSSKVGLSVAVASVVLLAIVGVAWLGGRSAHADPDLGLGSAPTSDDAVAIERPVAPRRAAVASADPVAPAVVAEQRPGPQTGFGTVRVTVHDARGVAVVGARIDLLAWGDPYWHERVRGLVTDRDGAAVFEQVHSGRVGVHVDGGGTQSRADVHVDRRTEIAIRLERGIDVTGVVLDERGVPIAGAVVEAGEDPRAEPRRASAPTGADGRYVLTDVPHTQAVWARAPSNVASQAVLFGTPPWTRRDSAELDFVLADPDALLEFVVVDGRGAPIADAQAAGIGDGDGDLQPTFRADGSLVMPARASRVRGDAAGRVRMPVETARVQRVVVGAPGFALRELAIDQVGSLVTLSRGGRLAGVARFDDGVAAEQATIEARVDGVRDPLRATAGAEGAWEILDVPSGAFELHARASDAAPAVEMRGTASPGATSTWDPVLEHARVIRGIARSASGVPAKTWLVKAVRHGVDTSDPTSEWLNTSRDPRRLDLRQCWTNEFTGEFAVPCAADGAYRLELRARAQWNGPVHGALDGVPAGATDVDLRVQLERGIVRVRFVGANGRPASGALTLVGTTSGARQRGVAGADGTIERELYPGAYYVIAWPEGGAPRSLGARHIGADQVVDLGDLRVDAIGDLVLRGAADERLVLRGADGLRYETVRSGRDLVATALPTGEYTASGARADGTEFEARGRVEAGRRTELTVE